MLPERVCFVEEWGDHAEAVTPSLGMEQRDSSSFAVEGWSSLLQLDVSTKVAKARTWCCRLVSAWLSQFVDRWVSL